MGMQALTDKGQLKRPYCQARDAVGAGRRVGDQADAEFRDACRLSASGRNQPVDAVVSDRVKPHMRVNGMTEQHDTEPTAEQDKPKRPAPPPMPKEIGGPKGPEPTRYGDWEVNGRCSDF